MNTFIEISRNIPVFYYIISGLILYLIVNLVINIRHDRSKKINEIVQEIPLERLAELWRQGKIGQVEIPLEKLTPIWKESKNDDDEQPDIILRHERARKFWQYIAKYFKRYPDHYPVCAHILTILDQEGDCPSVVNVQTYVNDFESSWDSNTYKMLGMVTLFDHSLNVAEQIIKQLIDIEAEHVIPDGVIAALAHDVGKIPSLQPQLYASGDHPIVSGTTLITLQGFKNLNDKDKEAISNAVKYHHKNAEGLLSQQVRRADQQARQIEMDWAADELHKVQKAHSLAISSTNSAAPEKFERSDDIHQDSSAPQEPMSGGDIDPIVDPDTAVNMQPASPMAVNPDLDPQVGIDNTDINENALVNGTQLQAALAGEADPGSQQDDSADLNSDADIIDTKPANDSIPSKSDIFSFAHQEDAIEADVPQEKTPCIINQDDSNIKQTSAIPQAAVAPDPYPQQVGIVPPLGAPATTPPGDPSKAYAADQAIYGGAAATTTPEKPTYKNDKKPELVPVNNWLDIDELIEALKPKINKTKGNRFSAFSMSDGTVYIHSGAIETELRMMASRRGESKVPTYGKGSIEMKNVLFSVVNILRSHGFIEESLIGPDYYGGYFLLYKPSGVVGSGYYTPFRAAPFGMPGELELLKKINKSDHIIDFIQVVPDTGQLRK